MLVVRKEGKAHSQYNSFRSAFELLESVGRAPRDRYTELEEDMPPLQRLKMQINKLTTENLNLTTENRDLKNTMNNLRVSLQNTMNILQLENQTLRADVDELLKKQS